MPDTPTRASKTPAPPPAPTTGDKKAEEVQINGRPYYPGGDPDMPLSDRELNDKFLELAGPVLGTKAEKKLEQLWRLEAQSTLA